MRVLTTAILLFAGLVSASNYNITRQGYFNGTATVSGCGVINPNATNTVDIGACVNTTNAGSALSSIRVNDCLPNGVFTIAQYNGSDICDPNFVSGMTAGVTTDSTGASYCNVGSQPQPSYNTYSCPVKTQPSKTDVIQISGFVKAAGATGCSGSGVNYTIPVATCTLIPQLNQSNPKVYVIASCVNGLVTSTLYGTADCSIPYANGAIAATPIPFGPFSQAGQASGNNKTIGAPGSSCASFPEAFATFTCMTSGPTATPAPTATPTPTPAGNGTTSPPTRGAATSITAGAAAFVALVIAAVANLL